MSRTPDYFQNESIWQITEPIYSIIGQQYRPYSVDTYFENSRYTHSCNSDTSYIPSTCQLV